MDAESLLKQSSFSDDTAEDSLLNQLIPPTNDFETSIHKSPNSKVVRSMFEESSRLTSKKKDGTRHKGRKPLTWHEIVSDRSKINEHAIKTLAKLKKDHADNWPIDNSLHELSTEILDIFSGEIDELGILQELFCYFLQESLHKNLNLLKIERRTLPPEYNPRTSSYTEVFAQLRLTQRSISRHTRNTLGIKHSRIKEIDDGDIEETVTFDWRYPNGTAYEKTLIRRAIDETSGKLSCDRIVETLHSYKPKKESKKTPSKPPISIEVTKKKISPTSALDVFSPIDSHSEFITKLHHLLIVVEGLRNSAIFVLNPMLIDLAISEEDITWAEALSTANDFGAHFTDGLMPTAPESSKEYSFWLQQQYRPFMLHDFMLPGSGKTFSPKGIYELILREADLFQLWLDRKYAEIKTVFFTTEKLAYIMIEFVQQNYHSKYTVDVADISPIMPRRPTDPRQTETDDESTEAPDSMVINDGNKQIQLQRVDMNEQQRGWNCGDIAFRMSNGLNPKQDRSDFVKWAIKNCDTYNLHELMADEIMSAALISHAEFYERKTALNGYQTCLSLLKQITDENLLPIILNEMENQYLTLSASLHGLPETMMNTQELLTILNELALATQSGDNTKENEEFKKLKAYCQRKDIFTQYMKTYYGNNEWIAFQPAKNGRSIIDVIAIYTKAQIKIIQDGRIIYESIARINGREFNDTTYGLYNGSNHFIKLDIEPTITTMPEPDSSASESSEHESDITSETESQSPL